MGGLALTLKSLIEGPVVPEIPKAPTVRKMSVAAKKRKTLKEAPITGTQQVGKKTLLGQ
jgi:hypothetical protein